MITGERKIKISIEAILSRISEYDIFRYYMPNHDWKINRVTYFNTILFPIAIVVRVYEKIKGKNFEKGSINKQGKWSNEILRYLFEIEKIILKRTNFHYGLSMLCILSI